MSNKINVKRQSTIIKPSISYYHVNIPLILIGILISIYSITSMLPDHGHNLGYTFYSPWWTHVTYMFVHASIIHLIINSISFFFLWKFVYKIFGAYTFFSFCISISCSFIAIYYKPTLGISGVTYALTGMILGLLLVRKINLSSKNLILFLACILAGLTVSYFKHNSNLMLHLYCLLSGIIMSFVIRWIMRCGFFARKPKLLQYFCRFAKNIQRTWKSKIIQK